MICGGLVPRSTYDVEGVTVVSRKDEQSARQGKLSTAMAGEFGQSLLILSS